MRMVKVVLGIAALSVSAAALRAEVKPPVCPDAKRITTEKDAIELAKQYFAKQRKLLRQVGGKGIDAVARNLSGDCCEVVKDEHGWWHVDMMDKRDNPRTVFSYSFDECRNPVESRHSKQPNDMK